MMTRQMQTLLVVDDSRSMRAILVRLLKDEGCATVLEADSGQAAWHHLAQGEHPVDAVVSDWAMPHMDGLALLRQVRGQAALAHLPFLMLTAEGQRCRIVQALQAGADGYLIKPFTLEGLRAGLQAAARRAVARSMALHRATPEPAHAP